ncbi:MAG: hypothetical protein GY945_14515 [Rhodobacteraceae bacterium]|nr:hypothetical protein [Paracoccaceae bacterium]
MKRRFNRVSGVNAPPPRPDWRGFVIVGLLLSVPAALVGFSVDFLMR